MFEKANGIKQAKSTGVVGAQPWDRDDLLIAVILVIKVSMFAMVLVIKDKTNI